MTYREIINETLKLMNVVYDYDIAIADINVLKSDPNIGGYINGMYGSLNRCFSELERLDVLDNKKHIVEPKELLANANVLKFDTKQIADLLKVVRVVEEGGWYDNEVDYISEGNDIVLPMLKYPNRKYTILYKPMIPRVMVDTAEDYEIGVPDHIATYIPYFIKGDLYRDDEPAEANQAMNFFDESMRFFMPRQTSSQNTVDLVYNMENM